jgi:hypothetical protein
MEMTTAAELYDAISLPALHMLSTALVIALVLPLAAVLGHAMGHAQRKRMIAGEKELDQTTGKTSLGAILTLLGLLLAFSFGNSISVTQARKTATIQEAAALSTAFLRADYLGEPGRTELKVAILEYTKTRVMPGDGKLDTVEKVQLFLQTSLKSQAKLWPLTLQVTADPLPQPMKIFVAGAVNNANTTSDRTFYYEILPSNQLELGLYLESERLLHAKIDQIGVDTQREVVKE